MTLNTGNLPPGFPLRVGRANDALAEQVHALAAISEQRMDSTINVLARISEQLTALSDQLAEALPRPPFRRTIAFDAINSFAFQSRGYRHSRIRVLANVTLTVRDTLGTYTLNLTPGWNVLDVSNGADLSAGAAAMAELELTDALQ